MRLAQDVTASFGWEPDAQKARVAAGGQARLLARRRPKWAALDAESPSGASPSRFLRSLGRGAARPSPASPARPWPRRCSTVARTPADDAARRPIGPGPVA